MNFYRRTVFTLHGINTDGAWQQAIKAVLEPHFHCVPLPYTQFRKLGATKVLLGRPWRGNAVNDVMRRYFENAFSGAERPHLIAHSFGTRIVAELLEYPFVKLGRVIFVGSPLRADFPWKRVLRKNPHAFKDLRNEVGQRDWVIRLAGIVGRIHPALGDAGRRGFSLDGGLVHNVDGPLLPCDTCAQDGGATARIHNVAMSGYRHSSWFVSNGHPANLWLPYLWGIDSEEYSNFIEQCLDVAHKVSQMEWSAVIQAEAAFSETKWSWTRSGNLQLTLGEYLANEIKVYQSDWKGGRSNPIAMPHLVASAVRLVWDVVTQAVEERKKEGERDDNVIRKLRPRTAIGAAAEAVCKEN